MLIYCNDAAYTIEATCSVAEFIQTHHGHQQGMALALNQTVLPKSQWPHTILQAQDRLHLFQIVAGG